MKISRAEYEGHHEEKAYARVKSDANSGEKHGLAECADEGENISHKVELSQLSRMWEDATDAGNNGVSGNIEPASYRISGRILPCLETVAMGQVMSGFPIVEGLIAVLDGCKCRRY